MWFNTAIMVLAALQGSEGAQGVTARPPLDQAGGATIRAEPQAPVDAEAASLERIRRELARSQSPRILAGLANRTPNFRVYVRGTPFRTTSIEETFHQDWQPVQPGSIYHAEFLARVTRPEAMPYAGFTAGEFAAVAATSLMSSMAIGAIKESVKLVRKGVRARQLAQTRKDIRDALAAIERNKRAANNNNNQTRPPGKQP